MSETRQTPVSEKQLLEEARRETGLSDFGPEDFREGLRVLIETIEKNPFTEKGRRRNRRRLLQLLATRLRVQEAFRRHPEIREREIRSPVFLTGLPRSGTSALFSLLAADRAARPLLLWETQFPDPNWELAPGATDPRFLAVRAYMDAQREQNPEFTKIHYAGADEPEECVLLHALGFDGGQTGYELILEPYRSWFPAHDLRPLYRYYADLLRLLDWQRPGERWLLKTPSHLWALDALVEVFPDCHIVWNHRDPAACVPSIASMIHMILAAQMDVSKPQVGALVFEHYAASMDRGLALREAIEPGRIFDVGYDALVADGLGVVRELYASFGLPLDAAAEAAMQAHRAARPKDKHGRHRYDLAEFGLDRDEVEARFRHYTERFGALAGRSDR